MTGQPVADGPERARPVAGGFWHALGRQLEHPRGAAGLLVGRLMRLANDRPTRLAVERMDIGAADRLLDLGCGSGQALALMAARAPRGQIVGLDQSDAMLRQAARLNSRAIADGRVRLMHGQFDALPFEEAGFDGILACNIVYFWPDPAVMLGRLRGLLRPGGRIVLYATEAASMAQWKFTRTGTHRLIDAAALCDALIAGGFDPGAIEMQSCRLPGNIMGILARATRSKGI